MRAKLEEYRENRGTSSARRISAALLGMGGCLIAASLQAQDCWRETLTPSSQFSEFNFVTWGDLRQSRAVLVDLIDRRSFDLVLKRDCETGSSAIQPDLLASRNESLFPDHGEFIYGVKANGGGFVGLNVLASGGQPSTVQWYDRSLRKRGSSQLLSQVEMSDELTDDSQVLAILDWQPVADLLFAYGTLGVAGREEQFRHGFFVARLLAPGIESSTPAARMVLDLPTPLHYVFHHDFIAVRGDIVYFLEMGLYPSLRYYDTRIDELGILEDSPYSDEVLLYPPKKTMEGMYKAIEVMRTPVGLYVSGDALYAVLRAPGSNGSSNWDIVKLQPDMNKGLVEILGTVRLPTQRAARHLYLLPGDKVWLVLELESLPPRSMKHHLLAVMTVPNAWITEPRTSPIAESAPDARTVLCRSP